MALSTKSILPLIDATADRLERNYSFKVNIDGLQETIESLQTVLDVDFDELRVLNKEAQLWIEYLSELICSLQAYLDQYKNVKEIFEYLSEISKKEKQTFLVTAPKYKIPTRDYEKALVIVEDRKKEEQLFVRNLSGMIKMLDSYNSYMKYHYYRTNHLVYKSYSRFANSNN